MAATSSGGHLGGSKDILSDRKYCREHTVIVNVRDNSSVKPEDIIHFIHENCGVGSLFACVPKSGNLYEITVDGKAPIQYLLEGIKIGQQTFECHEVVPSSIVVSFMHLPAYIEDAEIEMTLRSMKVELLSQIKRRFYPGTTIADGTRYAKVKLPDTMNSFPYTIKFQKEYYRCIHNGQMKVCSLCYSSEHLFRACPQFTCFKCKRQGHYARACISKRCAQCNEWNCSCRMSDQEYDETDWEEEHEVKNGNEAPYKENIDEEAQNGDEENKAQEGEHKKTNQTPDNMETEDTGDFIDATVENNREKPSDSFNGKYGH